MEWILSHETLGRKAENLVEHPHPGLVRQHLTWFNHHSWSWKERLNMDLEYVTLLARSFRNCYCWLIGGYTTAIIFLMSEASTLAILNSTINFNPPNNSIPSPRTAFSISFATHPAQNPPDELVDPPSARLRFQENLITTKRTSPLFKWIVMKNSFSRSLPLYKV